MTDNNKYENKAEEHLEKQEARQLTEEELKQVTGGAHPLVIVDGVSLADDLGGINPADIEGMAVLKDASATALYGSKAGN